jgi:hypothetical protein
MKTRNGDQMSMLKAGSMLALALLLGACASGSPGGRKADAGERIGDAAAAPLQDLNLSRVEIPAVLQEARKAPYALPAADTTCAALAQQLAALDEVLGPDLDAPAAAKADLMSQGGDAMVGALRNTAEGVIPMRGWVRKLTGAERHSKAVEAALRAGAARRSFLRGYAAARACPPGP